MLHFYIPKMTCGGCAKSVTQALLSVDPHAPIETNTALGEVWVDSTMEESDFIAALSKVGFPLRNT